MMDSEKQSQMLGVLIETYWNVKQYELPQKMLSCSINRNILECKVVYSQMRIRPAIGINRNILECKDKY